MIAVGDVVRVKGFSGVACHYVGPELENDEDTCWTGYQLPTGRHLVVMVGDDHRHVVDFEDMSPLEEDAYCDGCGQIGCGHGSPRDA